MGREDRRGEERPQESLCSPLTGCSHWHFGNATGQGQGCLHGEDLQGFLWLLKAWEGPSTDAELAAADQGWKC